MATLIDQPPAPLPATSPFTSHRLFTSHQPLYQPLVGPNRPFGTAPSVKCMSSTYGDLPLGHSVARLYHRNDNHLNEFRYN